MSRSVCSKSAQFMDNDSFFPSGWIRLREGCLSATSRPISYLRSGACITPVSPFCRRGCGVLKCEHLAPVQVGDGSHSYLIHQCCNRLVEGHSAVQGQFTLSEAMSMSPVASPFPRRPVAVLRVVAPWPCQAQGQDWLARSSPGVPSFSLKMRVMIAPCCFPVFPSD